MQSHILMASIHAYKDLVLVLLNANISTANVDFAIISEVATSNIWIYLLRGIWIAQLINHFLLSANYLHLQKLGICASSETFIVLHGYSSHLSLLSFILLLWLLARRCYCG